MGMAIPFSVLSEQHIFNTWKPRPQNTMEINI